MKNVNCSDKRTFEQPQYVTVTGAVTLCQRFKQLNLSRNVLAITLRDKLHETWCNSRNRCESERSIAEAVAESKTKFYYNVVAARQLAQNETVEIRCY